jgi:hypothetical protein
MGQTNPAGLNGQIAQYTKVLRSSPYRVIVVGWGLLPIASLKLGILI